MTQVSRMPLPKGLEEQMHRLFRRSFVHLQSETDVSSFLEDLLTPTEKIMLAKRLAIAVLLSKGHTQRDVGKILKVSLPTVNDVSYSLKYRGAGYKKVIDKLNKDQLWQDILEGIEETLEHFIKSAHPTLTPRLPKEQRPVDHL